MNYSNPACFINSCDQTACCVFDSMSYDELNTLWIVSKINFRLLSNKEQLSRNICFCKAHYDQLLLISQCELCGNRSMDMVTLQEDNVRECQLILNEDNVPVTIKSGIFICKSCNFYILLRSNTTITTITRELQRHIDTTITRIKNKNISVTNGLECIQLSMVIFLPKNISNFFTLEFFTMTSQIVSSLFNLDTFRTLPLLVSSEIMNIIESITVSITTSIETGLVTEKLVAALLKNKWDLKFSVENSTALTLNRRNEPAFLDENSSVPRIKNPNILSVKPTTPVDEPTVADHKPLHNKSLVFEMNQTRSTSSRTEFPELSSQRADPTTLSSPKPNMIRLFKNLKVPYSNGMDFVNHLINLETCRNLGNLTVGNNKTTHRQRTSDTVTTSSHIHCSLEHKEYQTISHADDDETDPSN